MSLIQTVRPNDIVGKQGPRSVEVGALAPVFEKSDKEPKPKLFGCKNIVKVATFTSEL